MPRKPALDEVLDRIESEPDFQEMMRKSEEDIRAGRLVSHTEVKKRQDARASRK